MNYQSNNENHSSNKNQSMTWLQITAGQGPKECGWVVAQVFRTICQEAKLQSLKLQLIETLAYDKMLRKQDMIEPDAYLSVLVRIEGQGAKVFSKSWAGSIKWHGESPFPVKDKRPKHKRLNWFVGVVGISAESLKKAECSINEQQLKQEVSFEAMRSGGPGGQHVNKTSSAVRITHKPTGIKIRVEAERSQHRNKQLAMERLKMILEQGISEGQKDQERNRWLNHYQVGRGNPLRTFIGSDFKEKN
jgi:peptide chain release factor